MSILLADWSICNIIDYLYLIIGNDDQTDFVISIIRFVRRKQNGYNKK